MKKDGYISYADYLSGELRCMLAADTAIFSVLVDGNLNEPQ
jgi:hypothetical protein